MHQRRPMRLLLREHGICSGTETVNIHLVDEFSRLVERVVWVMPASRMKFFQQILPPSDRLIYELPYYPPRARLPNALRKATSLALRQKTLPGRDMVRNLRRSLFDLWLKRLVRRHQITHCFCSWTFGVDAPRIRVPLGVMLMDVRWKRFPGTFPQVNINAVESQFCDWLRKSTVVFPVSEMTASDIRQFYPWHAGQTRVVPHGADVVDQNTSNSVAAKDANTRRCTFFCPAAANGHKNHLTLFRACVDLFKQGFDFDVILTGFSTEYFGPNQTNGRRPQHIEVAVELARTFLHQHETLLNGRIKALGYVDRTQIGALYEACSAVVLPTYFEGFGLPLLEALQNGATVVCSDIEAHREQLIRYGCVDQVRLFPPSDAHALATEMEKVLTRPTTGLRQNRMPPAALKRWTWRDVAETYLDSLGTVSPGHNGC
jgi:glycosyltransferase involved in cell wall biosynthesis